MEKEYTVVVNKGVDLTALEYEITASSGSGPIPKRSVDIANPRPGSKRQTHFMLTDAEAKELENDPRILAVEIPPDQRSDIQIGLHSTQFGNFTKPTTFTDNTLVNWGLRRSIMEDNAYQNITSSDNIFPYALTGKGVDIVIQDSGIQPDHPDFIDSNGISRVKPIDWYAAQSVVSGTQSANYNRDFDGHGTLCASISAGNVYGFAKDAHIYSMKISGLEGAGDTGTGTPVADCFDVIKEWHNAKTNGRPTVVNMSWGYSSTQVGDPTSGTYRGTPWVWGVDYTTDLALWQGTGVVIPVSGTTRKIPVRIASVDADVDELIAAGVHVAIAAGNDYYKGDLSGGADYNNTVIFGASSLFYARGSSPHSNDSFIVGNIDTSVFEENGIYKDRTRGSSSKGPRVNIWAPGTNIVGAVSTTNVYTTLASPVDNTFKIVSNSGTSFAAPQVAGVAALHLQVNANSTPAQLKTKLLAEAKPIMYDTASATDYASFTTSLLGASTKVLFDKYGRQPVEVSGQNLTLQRATPTMMNISVGVSLSLGTNLDISKTWSQGTHNYAMTIKMPTSGSAPYPVAIVLHGNGGTGPATAAQFVSVLPGHIIVGIQGYGNSWNISNETSNGPDIQMLNELIDSLKTYENVDSTKIRIIGISNGGGLALRAAVEITDTAVDVIVCNISQTNSDQYRSSQFYYPSNEEQTGDAYTNDGYNTLVSTLPQRKILQLNGRNDTVVPYNGGVFLGLTFLSAANSAYAFAQTQGYSGSILTGSTYGTDSVLVDYGNVVFLNDGVAHNVSSDMEHLITRYLENNYDITTQP